VHPKVASLDSAIIAAAKAGVIRIVPRSGNAGQGRIDLIGPEAASRIRMEIDSKPKCWIALERRLISSR